MLNSISTAAAAEAAPNTQLRQAKPPQETGEAAGSAAAGGANVGKTSLDLAIEKLNAAMETVKTEQHFMLDEDLGRPIVKIVNSETQEVIRQIPTEEAIRISKNIDEMIGLLMDDRI